MTAFVNGASVRAARQRASRVPLGPVDERRWDELCSYAESRRVDPTPARAATLRKLLDLPGASDAETLAVAAQLLRADVSAAGAAPAGQTLELCLGWLAEDVRAAAPLLELFTGHHRDPEGGPPPADPELVRRIGGWLADRGGPDTVVEQASVISGGFSRLMLDVQWRGGHAGGGRGVFRIEQEGMFATEGAREVSAMRALHAAGYPVPEVLWEEPDPAVVGHPFFVMEHVAGAARTDARGLDDMLRSMHALHALDARTVDQVAALDGLPAGSTPERAIEAQLAHWLGVYRSAVPAVIPLLERAFAWLDEHLRPTGPSVVVHGDPGPGNALQDERGVAAVIDWEFAHAGDAAEDWAYLAFIRGRKLASADQWKARIAETVGVEYDDATWRAWEVYNNVKGACVNLTALDVFRRSARPNPDLLAIGIAVHLRFLNRVVELIESPPAADIAQK